MQEDTPNTNARAVLEMLRAAKNHPTALDVYETVRQARPRIGQATIYRILHQLTTQGLIKELGRSDQCCRYDARIQRHDHAICTTCGALIDIPTTIGVADTALQEAAQAAGVELTSYEVRIYGHCSACQPSIIMRSDT